MKKFVLVLCLLSFSLPLFAQQGTVGISGFSFVAPLKVGVGTDNNFLVDRTPPNERLFDLSLPPSVQRLAPGTFPKRLDDNPMTITLCDFDFNVPHFQEYPGGRRGLVRDIKGCVEKFRECVPAAAPQPICAKRNPRRSQRTNVRRYGIPGPI